VFTLHNKLKIGVFLADFGTSIVQLSGSIIRVNLIRHAYGLKAAEKKIKVI
jgi:hypothetical protein